jgi:hypothetical protein
MDDFPFFYRIEIRPLPKLFQPFSFGEMRTQVRPYIHSLHISGAYSSRTSTDTEAEFAYPLNQSTSPLFETSALSL